MADRAAAEDLGSIGHYLPDSDDFVAKRQPSTVPGCGNPNINHD
jgi:hypothetical protein